ncbi:dynein heavy chain 6, axonemal-like isoform X2 [Alosa sapidissima]|uniref:dynein heavy chain 6, axonemal-like isoform X2 n=1 Tax=Alosa sapidissima TaxID=34773 RepID=UPI001C08183E|nr:dynein heavy chain 6, axonemal-like isoform X2 [Alosa sapidissima]
MTSDGNSLRIDTLTLMHRRQVQDEDDEDVCSLILGRKVSAEGGKRSATLSKLPTIRKMEQRLKNQSFPEMPPHKSLNAEKRPIPFPDNVRSTGRISLSPLRPKRAAPTSHRATWDSLVIPTTWNYKGVRVKDARFDDTEPEDDNVVNHIMRLRNKHGWPTIPGRRMRRSYSDYLQENPHEMEDTGEYVYCIKRSGDNDLIQYNPYDLKVVSVQTAKQHSHYWTVSASYIHEVSVLDSSSGEMMPVLDWLAERELFQKINQLPWLSKFRLWKSFTIWKTVIRRSVFSKANVSENLFFLDDILAKCLVQIRILLEASFNHRYPASEDAIFLIKWDESQTRSLWDFCEAQKQQREFAAKQLQHLHDKVASMIRSACLETAELQGAVRLFQPWVPDHGLRPLYTQVAQWRTLLGHFGRFLAMVDYMFEDALSNLLKAAIFTLHSAFWSSYNNTRANVKPDTGTKCPQGDDIDQFLRKTVPSHAGSKEVRAAFEVNVVLTVLPDAKEDAMESTLQPSDQGTTGESENQEEVPNENSTPVVSLAPKKLATMTLSPSLNDFMMQTEGVFEGIQTVIDKQISFNDDPSLLDLHSPPVFDRKLSVDMISEEERSETSRPWPDLELLLGQDSVYQMQVSEILSIVQTGFAEVKKHCSKMEGFCEMVETAMVLDIGRFVNGEKWTAQDMRSVLLAHTESVEAMKRMEMRMRVNMLLVRCEQYQRDCLHYPQALITSIHSLLPGFATKKNLELMEVIQGALRKLELEIVTVEEFVDHLNFLSQISEKLPALERQYHFLVQLYTIINEFQIMISPEDLALYHHLIPSFYHLKSTVLICETKKDDKIFTFNADLSKQLTKLRHDLVLIKLKINNPLLLCSDTLPEMVDEVLQALTEELAIHSNKAYSYFSFRELLDCSFPKKNAPLVGTREGVATSVVELELADVSHALTLRGMLWDMQKDWDRQYDLWKTSAFDQLNVDHLQDSISRFTQTLYMLEKGLPENDIVPQLKQKLGDFKLCLPIIVAMRNPHLHKRHMEEIHKKTGRFLVHEHTFTLGDLLNLKILQYSHLISDISTTATHEATLEAMLNNVIDLWKNTDFRLITHNSDTSTVNIIASADDIMAQLEESQTTIISMKSSRYVEPIKGLIDEWERKLNQFAQTLGEWVMCQKRWLYLEPIFSAGGIQRQLPEEAKLFRQVDQAWQRLMLKTQQRPNALRSGTFPGVLEILQNNNMQLEKIQKCLEDYLESKRTVFPRFYFLSNEELLDVLTHSRSPSVIQPYLVKCFSNIHHLEMQEQAMLYPVLVRLHSCEGETVTMPKNVQIRGPVEQWMGNVETAMYSTVKRHMKLAVLGWNPADFRSWVLSHPGQVILTVTQIMFCSDCEKCLSGGSGQQEGLRAVRQQVMGSLEDLMTLVLEPLACHQQSTVEALFTILLHCRDVLSNLIHHHIASAEDFEWRRQLLYDWHDTTSMCYVVQAKASFPYGYEYQGCLPRLIITPLTDRCWLTLTRALSLHLGAALVGPAATGKTESVKDLANVLGKFCLVMNCTARLDYKMMGKLLSGMVQCGAWCCFDEFNCISVEVLSVIAAQLQSIKAAKNSHSVRFMFEGRDIRLNALCGYFITMNPSCRGRVELPENLKTLVRPVAMMVPNVDFIAEIILLSGGFKSAKILSRKMVHLYQVASKQLSPQDHYDFSMRAIKPVLLFAGHKRRAKMSMSLSSEEEFYIIICALQDFNVPKLIPEDVPLFKSIMQDIFPNVIAPKAEHPQLEIAITTATSILGLEPCPSQAEKATQLYTQILARVGVMLVGPTGGGKTTVRLILQHALDMMLDQRRKRSSMGVQKIMNVDCFTINAKCLGLGELFGQRNPNTLEWTDGLLASVIRAYAKELTQLAEKRRNKLSSEDATHGPVPQASTGHCQQAARHIEKWRWIIMDGPVDNLWVESLNTALDESRTLCLMNGERISLPEGLSFLFEIDSLVHATPATISRCAMVYVDPLGMVWKLFVDRWLQELPEPLQDQGVAYLKKLFENTVEHGVAFMHKHQKLLSFPIPELSLVMTLCSILGSIFNLLDKNGGLGKSEDVPQPSSNSQKTSIYLSEASNIREECRWFLQKYPEKLTSLLGKLYVFAYTWAFGGVFSHVDELDDSPMTFKEKSDPLKTMPREFQSLLRKLFDGGHHYGITLPTGNRTLFSYFVDLQTNSFVLWDELVSPTDSLIRKGMSVLNPYLNDSLGQSPCCEHVGNIDSIRYSFLLSLLLLNNQPVLLTGDSGVGKSILIESMLKKLQKDQEDIGNPLTVLGQVFLHNQAKIASLLEDVSLVTDGFLDGDKSPVMSAMKDLFGRLNGIQSGPVEMGIMTRTLQCTAHMEPSQLQAHVLQGLTKRAKNLFGGPKNKKVLIFLDDINMPVPDSGGDQPCLELVRQFIELQGVYDAKTLTWKGIQDVTFCAAGAPPGGGRQQLSRRLLRHFSVLVLTHPSQNTMHHIFQVQLGKFFGSREFCKEVRQCCNALVSASIAVYMEMCHTVLPTPAKYHYTFNLRDLSKVIYGLMQSHESELRSEEAAAHLFAHEASRVFHDRLMEDQDRKLFHQILSNELQIHFKIFWTAEALMKEPVMFGDYLDPSIPPDSRIYKHIQDKKKVLSALEDCHKKHVMTKPKFPMVFFREAVEHITRSARIFRQQGAHMMLIGLDGTGKEECVKLACHLTGCHLYQLSVSHNCTYIDFRDDLKRVFYQSGIHRKRTVLLMTDAEILKDSVMKDLDCLLKCGDVPGLFTNEEIDHIISQIKTNSNTDKREAYAHFIQQVRQRLHICLALSPAGPRLRQFCWAYPALLGCCNIDWYSPWSRESLLQVAKSTYNDFNHPGWGLQDKVAHACVDMHYSVSQIAEQYWQETRRPYYVVPSIFSEYMSTFTKMFYSREEELYSIRNRYTNGLTILSEATSLVTVMKEELVALSYKIEEKSKEIEILMEKLQKDAEIVEQVRAIVQMEEGVMAQETQIVQDYAQEAHADLNKALPLLENAIAALDSLDKNDISEIRVYTNPPDLVLTVMYAICILLQQKPTWTVAKQLLADPGFLKRLVNLDKDSLPEKVFFNLRRYSKDPEFTPEKVGRVSMACRSMCQWILALDHYHNMNKIIEPKQKKVRVAEEALAKAKWNIKQKQKNLSKIERHQADLQQSYDASVAEKTELAARRELTIKRVQRAGQLIAALSDEKERWESVVTELDLQLKHIVGDTIISAAFITYCGPLTAAYRETLVKTWQESCRSADIAASEDYTFIGTMTKKNEVQHWHNNGLPSDQTSTENAIIIKNGPHCPVIVDPQGQAKHWLICKEGVGLYKVQASNPNYMKTVERAIRMGDAVLIQDISENVDPCLRPVLVKNITIREGHSFIKIGDTELEYNPNFRLYLTTSLPNPHFLPGVCIIIKLINFNAEYESLQEQLLSSAFKLQQPELEQQHNQLLHTIIAHHFDLHQLEERSLQLLQETMGNILDDQSLIDNMRKTKETFSKISQRAQMAKDKDKEIGELRKKYLPIASYSTHLYIVLTELTQINYMYQFSLEWFLDKYMKAVQWGNEAPERPGEGAMTRVCSSVTRTDFETMDHSRYLVSVLDRITESIYKEVSLALFAEHQLCFSFLMCCRIMQMEGGCAISGCPTREPLPAKEWYAFLHTPMLARMLTGAPTPTKTHEPPAYAHWLTDSMWTQCQYLSAHFPAFSGLCHSLQANPGQWSAFHQADGLYSFLGQPYMEPGSAPVATTPVSIKHITVFAWENLSGFQRLILIKVLRTECLISAVRRFVLEKFGAKYAEGSKMSLRDVYEHSSSNIPIIFLLSPGTDPASLLLRLAHEQRGSSLHLDMVSLGQGQGPRADELVSKAQVLKGRWVFLQNCHLAASFMPRLHTIVNSLKWKGSDLDPQFRLWLSSKPDPVFPVSILQRGFKVAVESPQGLKEKLLHIVGINGEVTDKTFSKADCGSAWKSLVFSLCFFHAIVQERKKYGTLGWNIPYTFTSSDLEVSLLNQEAMLTASEGAEVPWAALHYLMGEVVYGGHIMDPWDHRCLTAILQRCYNPRVLQEGLFSSQAQGYPAFPKDASWSQCHAYIENMPEKELAELFGIDRNTEAIVRQHQAQQLLQAVINLQPQVSDVHLHTRSGRTRKPAEKQSQKRHSDTESKDKVVLKMANYILKKLPEQVESNQGQTKLQDVLAEISSEAKEEGGQHSLALLVVLKEEIRRFDRLLAAVHSTLLHFCSAIKGETLMTQNMEEIHNALLTMVVPAAWKVLSYESCKALGSWVLDLERRVSFIQAWSDHVKSKHVKRTEQSTGGGTFFHKGNPRRYWLSGFFFPQGFLTAVLQTYARKRSLPMDSLCFSYHVQKDTLDWSTVPHKTQLLFEGADPPEDGVLVYGLYLNGARWDPESQTLQETLPKLQHYPMPEIHFLPCQKSDEPPPHRSEPEEHLKTGGEGERSFYECPLYCTSKRAGYLSSTGFSSNFITAMSLPTTIPASQWIFKGTTMLCQLDE